MLFKTFFNKGSWKEEIMFEMPYDEYSVLGSIPEHIDNIINGMSKKEEILPTGCGAVWKLKALETGGLLRNKECIEFQIWNMQTNKGYRFVLSKSKLEELEKYILKIEEYMVHCRKYYV